MSSKFQSKKGWHLQSEVKPEKVMETQSDNVSIKHDAILLGHLRAAYNER